VFSAERLSLGPEVNVAALEQEGNAYRYRYTGLRLLAHANGRYLLISPQWRRGQDPVYLLQEHGGIRFEFIVRP